MTSGAATDQREESPGEEAARVFIALMEDVLHRARRGENSPELRAQLIRASNILYSIDNPALLANMEKLDALFRASEAAREGWAIRWIGL